MVLHAYVVHVIYMLPCTLAHMERRWGGVTPARGQQRQRSVTCAASQTQQPWQPSVPAVPADTVDGVGRTRVLHERALGMLIPHPL